eukprot:6178133-Pleurochrysis_carterae.AAC.1
MGVGNVSVLQHHAPGSWSLLFIPKQLQLLKPANWPAAGLSPALTELACSNIVYSSMDSLGS